MLERGRLALTETIDVNDGHQIVQLIYSSQGCSLPHRPFGAFAVAQQHVSVIVQVVQPRA